MSDQQAAFAGAIREAVYRHIDGVAVGTTVAALYERGALKILAANERTPFIELAHEIGANPGFLRVALRLLADQGWLRFRGAPEADALLVEPTASGRVVFTELAVAYPVAVRFLAHAARIDALLDGAETEVLCENLGLLRREWDLPQRDVPPDVRRQVLAHLDGQLIAPLITALTRRGTLRAGADIALSEPALGRAIGILAWQGWVQTAGNTAWLTPEGELAVLYARQYRYPLVYLPMLRRVPDLLFGNPVAASSGTETHLDRALDLRFSGEVFNNLCRRPFLRMALPVFSRWPLGDQPALVVDTGCGDGTALAALYAGVRGATVRGQHLDTHPLLMVGVDPSPVAREITASRLAAAGIPHLVLDGDIADPERLRRDLAAHGLDATDALHVCKSAIHDRAHRSADADELRDHAPPVSFTAFAAPDGADLPAAELARSLAALLRRWRSMTRRHGWMVIEAHSVPAVTAARCLGRTQATTLDATHGYSCQYPVEPWVFAWAARTAGYTSRRHVEPGAAQLGHTVLTIDHLIGVD